MLKKLFIFSIIFNTNLVISQDVTYDCNEFEILTDGTVNIILGSATPISSTGDTGDTGTGNVLDIVSDLGCVVFDDGDPNTTDYKTSDVKCQRGVINNIGTFTGIFEYDRYPTDTDFTNDPNNISGYCYKGDIYIFAEVKCQDGTWASNGDWNGGSKYDPIVTPTGGTGGAGGAGGGNPVFGSGSPGQYANSINDDLQMRIGVDLTTGCSIYDTFDPIKNKCINDGYYSIEEYDPWDESVIGISQEEATNNYNSDRCPVGYYYHPSVAQALAGTLDASYSCVPNGTEITNEDLNNNGFTVNTKIELDAIAMQLYCSNNPTSNSCVNLTDEQYNNNEYMANLYCQMSPVNCKSQDENGNPIPDSIPDPNSPPVNDPVTPPENADDLNEDYCDQNPGNTTICGDPIPTEPPPEEPAPEEDICELYPNYAGCEEDDPYNPMDNPMYNVCISFGNDPEYCASQF